MIRRRVHQSRILVAALFAIAAASFFLPFVTVEQERVGTATGLELVQGEPRFSGRYVHAAYEGEVERTMSRGRAPATIALAAALLGFVASWSTHRVPRTVSFAAAVIGFFAALSIFQVTSSPFNEVDRLVGTWLAVFLLLAGSVLAGVRAATSPPRSGPGGNAPAPPWLRL
jgi:hypothetical protein